MRARVTASSLAPRVMGECDCDLAAPGADRVAKRAGRVAISVFIVVTLLAIGVTNLPESYLRREASKATKPYLEALGVDQNWRIFAPDPRQTSLQVEARVRYADGSVAFWRPPRGGDLVGAYWDYRWAKWIENVTQDANRRILWRPAAELVAARDERRGPHAAQRDARPALAGPAPAGRRRPGPRALEELRLLHPEGPVKRLGPAWQRFWFEPEATSTLALVRIAFGLVVLVWTLTLIRDADAFFTSEGVLSGSSYAGESGASWGLLDVFEGRLAVGLVLGALTLASLCLIVGLDTRIAALVVFVCVLSLERRSPFVFNSGDGLIRVIAFFLMLAPSGTSLSLDRWRRARETFWEFPARAPWALRLMQVQLSILYLASVWAKLAGDALEQRHGGVVRAAPRGPQALRRTALAGQLRARDQPAHVRHAGRSRRRSGSWSGTAPCGPTCWGSEWRCTCQSTCRCAWVISATRSLSSISRSYHQIGSARPRYGLGTVFENGPRAAARSWPRPRPRRVKGWRNQP